MRGLRSHARIYEKKGYMHQEYRKKHHNTALIGGGNEKYVETIYMKKKVEVVKPERHLMRLSL